MIMDERELRDTLGTNIKRYRTRYRWSQEELAEKLNISTNFLCSIEIGKKWLSPLTLVKLANTLHIDAYELFKPEGMTLPDAAKYTDDIFMTIKESIDEIHRTFRGRLK
jgi:transcriptional regulator with XRE-family HTH domain